MARNEARPQFHGQKVAAARVSLYTNFFLTVVKIGVGILSGSVSVLAEAAHSTTDLLASAIALLSVRMADHPPDEEHPYGHGKAESLSTLAEAVLLLGAAAYIINEAILKLAVHAGPQRVDIGIAVMALAAVVNVLLIRYMSRIARETDSQALKADMENHRADVYISVGVLVGLLLVRVTGRGFFDPLLALLVSLMILRAAWQLASGALSPLMDTHLPPEDIDLVRKVLEGEPGVLDYHKLRTRKSGSSRHIDAHVLMDDSLTLREAHDLAERVEDRIREELPHTQIILHTEPYSAEQRHQQEAREGAPRREHGKA